MRISDWSSDVCSSDLLNVGQRIVALLTQLSVDEVEHRIDDFVRRLAGNNGPFTVSVVGSRDLAVDDLACGDTDAAAFLLPVYLREANSRDDPGIDHVAQDAAGADGRKLIIIADDEETGPLRVDCPQGGAHQEDEIGRAHV